MKNPTTYSFISPESQTCADVMDAFMSKLFKPKSRLELCSIINITDDNGRELEVWYRLEDLALNNQSDESRLSYLVEQVKYNNKKVNLTTRGERSITDELAFINPEKI